MKVDYNKKKLYFIVKMIYLAQKLERFENLNDGFVLEY